MTEVREQSTPNEARPREVRVVAHSMLFYWWPVWAVGLLMAGLTWLDGHRLAVVPAGTQVVESYDGFAYIMSSFFGELQRRKIYRVATAYIVAAGFLIQMASAAFPAWELPNWSLRLVIVLLLISFPIALVLACAASKL